MSDATINFPKRVSHPDTPASGRVKIYVFDSGSSVEPFYKLDDGTESSLIGPQGAAGADGNKWFDGTGAPGGGLGNDDDYYLDTASGDVYQKSGGSWSIVGNIEGPIGPAGPTGPQGPAGPVDLSFDDYNATLLTLPDTTTPSIVRTWSINFPDAAEYRFQLLLAVRPHSASNDYEYSVQLDGSPVTANNITEEGKDNSAPQENPRVIYGTFGAQPAGTLDFDLLFSKEAAGGTAQLKFSALMVWKVS